MTTAQTPSDTGREREIARGALLGNTAVWGLSFVVIRDALGHTGALTVIAVRFTVALLALALLSIMRRSPAAALRRAWRSSLGPGLALFGGYLLQTEGLRYTTAAQAGFITGLSVVLVPPFALLLQGERLPPRAMAALPLALAGLALLGFGRTGGDAVGAGAGNALFGNVLVLGCAVCFALQIVLVARVARAGTDALALTFWQVAVVALGAVLLLPLAGEGVGRADGWLAAAALGVVATAGAYLAQSLAQRRVSAAGTALIYTAEPLFAAVFAVGMAGESVSLALVCGGGAIVAAMLLGV